MAAMQWLPHRVSEPDRAAAPFSQRRVRCQSPARATAGGVRRAATWLSSARAVRPMAIGVAGNLGCAGPGGLMDAQLENPGMYPRLEFAIVTAMANLSAEQRALRSETHRCRRGCQRGAW